MAKFDVTYQTETMLDDSTFLPLSTVSGTPGFGSLLESKPAIAIVYLAMLFVVSFWGGTTNFLILIVHVKNKKLNKAGRIFLVNLAIADLCVNLIAIPFCIIGVTHGEEYYQEHPHLCRFIGSFCFSVCICAILNLTMATINRYMYVCHNQIYMRFFNSRISLGTAIFIWAIALIVGACNILAWSGYVFDKKNHSCLWDRMANFNFTMFVSVVLIISPLTTITSLNILLLRRIHITKFNICMMGDIASMRTKRNVWMETLRASRTLFTMCVVFLICWIPYAVIVAFDTDDTYPEEVHLFITLLAHAHSATKFILYWLCNEQFSKTVYQVIGVGSPCQKFSPKSLASCSASSSSELSSTSSLAKDSEKRECFFCCRREQTLQRNSTMTSTSVEITRSDTDKKDASDPPEGDNCISETIYTMKHSGISTPLVPDFGTKSSNRNQKVKRSPKGSGNNCDYIPMSSETRETHP